MDYPRAYPKIEGSGFVGIMTPPIWEFTTFFSAHSSVHTLQYTLFSTPEGVWEFPKNLTCDVMPNPDLKTTLVFDCGDTLNTTGQW
jgi:hypothetical protein